ncbi:branched-chain amino acid ABC transporter substrate-binding protein [Nocardioides mangrovicus]|nr:branched-chain amino acid ABC transporter substrate-binding protein [Nocardioides mangrovicus]
MAAVAVVGALTLTGCGSSSSGGGGLKADSGSGGGSKTYTIAFEGPLSGDNAQLGINEVNGVELAIEQANADKSLGFKLKLLKADDVGDPAKAPAAAATVIQDTNVMGVVGPSFSGATQAVGGKYGDAGIAIVNPSASNGELQDQGFKTWHRVIPNDYAEGPAAADWLAKSVKKVIVVSDKSAYGDGVAGAVSKELKAKGVTVIEQAADATATKDYGPIAQTVKSSGAEALFYAGYDAQGAQFAKALKAVDYTGVRMSGNGVKSDVFTKGAGDAGNGWYFSCGCADATTSSTAKDFAAAYKAKFNTDPSTYSPEAYDAANIVIQAIKTAKGKGSVTRSSVNDAVSAIDYKGITGDIKFGSNGDLPEGSGVVNLYQDENGTIKSLGDITKAAAAK